MLNRLPNDKSVDWSKLKAFSDNYIKITEKLNLLLEKWENIVGKETVNPLTHSHTMTPFDAPGKKTFWKHCGKRKNYS